MEIRTPLTSPLGVGLSSFLSLLNKYVFQAMRIRRVVKVEARIQVRSVNVRDKATPLPFGFHNW